jgi:small-conductance mechanosensitive channel
MEGIKGINKFILLPFWGKVFFNNTVGEYVLALSAFAGLLVVFKIFQYIILHRLNKLAQKTKTDIDDTLIEIVRSVRPPFYSFLAFYLAIQMLEIAVTPKRFITAVLLVWVVYQITIAIQLFINYITEKKAAEDVSGTESALKLMGALVKGAVWAVGLLFVLSNMGVNVTSMIAGLGVGGIAIAFALQNILADLFSSFALYFDKPFVPGDFIIVGEHMGVVQKIGIKTTRIKALQGEEIVVSNQELTSARVQNFKKMEERRISFSFGVVYQTPTEKLKLIPAMVGEIIGSVEMARLDRVHFKQFGDSALSFEVVYYVLTPDYTAYMDIQQEINLKIKEKFEQEKIEMAYPTQTIYLAKG